MSTLSGGEPVAPVSRFSSFSTAPSAGPEEILALVSEAAAHGATFVAAPEFRMTPEALDGPTIGRFASLARERSIWIAASVPETAPTAGRHFQTTILLNARGALAAQYRTILTAPNDADAERGSVYSIQESIPTGRQRVGIVAGNDVQTGVPRLAARGATTVLVTAAWDADEGVDWSEICRNLSHRYGINLVVASRRASYTGIYLADGSRVSAESRIASATIADPPPAIRSSLGLSQVPVPVSYRTDERLIELGRQLFFDPIFSSTKKVSCATCHDPLSAFAARRAVGVDGAPTRRNVPSLLNVAYRGLLFWDGLSSSLESQAKFPMTHTHEMNRHYLDAVNEIRGQERYRQQFAALGRERIEYQDIAEALASYQRSLVSGDSAFDRYFFGGDETALDAAAVRGLGLFRGKAGCASCHSIGADQALFMDQDFHNTGVAFDPATRRFKDTGFGAISYQGAPGLFFTPSLRDVVKTPPYMHDGSIATLREVVEFYNRGGRPNPYLDARIKPLGLTPRESDDLVAFLASLTGSDAYSSDGRRLPATTKVVAIDFAPVAGDVGGNRRRIEALLARAASSGANMAVLPEHAESGVADVTMRATLAERSPAFFARMAKQHRLWIVGMAPEVLPSGRTYLRSMCFNPAGKLAGSFRKSMPDARDAGITGGDFRRLQPIETELGPIGILSAADLVRGVPRLAARGARLIAVSTSWTLEEAAEWRDVLRQLEAETGTTLLVSVLGKEEMHQVAWTLVPPAPRPALGLPAVPQPAGITSLYANVELGRRLFAEKSLSRDGRVSCASCHDPAKAFAGGEQSNPGVFGRVSKVHAPTLLNNGYRLFQTWEGRVGRPEEQIRIALLGFAEMDMTEEDVVAKVVSRLDYRDLAQAATGRDAVRFDDITVALAAYVRTLVSGNSRFDRYYFGHDPQAIGDSARRGLTLFQNKAHCAQCHTISADYALLSDNRFHNTGVGYHRFFTYLGYSGNGLEGNLVTNNKARGEYLTPSLRDVARTAPYMHDGSLATLADVVRFYNGGGTPNPFLDPRIRPLHLTAAEQNDLLAFLETLTGESTATISTMSTQGVERHAALSH
jgi:cytochrome c peroxidase